jgi:precorrin-2 dehydrogenase/sirohydrochlorin ferrochelatase
MGMKRKQNPTYYPLFLDLRDKKTVVVGGGRVAERKVRALLNCHARVRLISPRITPGLKKMVGRGKIKWQPRPFRKGDLRGALLVFAATDDPEVNRLVAARTKKTRTLVNAANLPEASSFLVPAVVRRGGMLIAVSTGGRSPALAKRVRQELGRAFGKELPDFLELLGKVRQALREKIPLQIQRQRILNRLVRSEVQDLIRSGHLHQARKRTQQITGLEGTEF